VRQDVCVPTHAAFLRGINVGGHNRVAMADLRGIVTALGHSDVATYIQSGNVLFTSTDADTVELAAALEERIADTLGVRPRVVVLAREQLAQVIADNPFPDETNPKCLHALFRGEDFPPDDVLAIDAAAQRAAQKDSPDELRIVGTTLFLRTPDGLGRSELAAQLARPGAKLTARNWATVTKMLALLEA